MKRFCTILLSACLGTLAVGLFVSFSGIPLPPVMTVFLPVSAILYGLFLISFVFGKEFAKSDHIEPDGISKSSAPKTAPFIEEHDSDHATGLPHKPAYG